jgi:hypothetical protein
MLNLIKYELIKKRKALIMALAVIGIIEIAMLFSLYKGGGWIGLTMLLTFVIIAGINFFIIIDCSLSYSSELNKSQGYMLFMTPNSGYSILGAKVIVSFIELCVGTLALFGVLYSNYLYAYHLLANKISPEAQVFIDMFKSFFQDIMPSIGQFLLILFIIAIQWFAFLITIYLAITLTKTLLSNIKRRGIISFILFIGLYIATTFLYSKMMNSLAYFSDMVDMVGISSTGKLDFSSTLYKFMIAHCVFYGAISSLFYFISGRLLNRRIDL